MGQAVFWRGFLDVSCKNYTHSCSLLLLLPLDFHTLHHGLVKQNRSLTVA
jgi:hypothetical protein